ncbi:MAG: hypothetical protein FWC21_04505 [Treponema sp.]|nr:hypothetical protein [Treponema sp.]
MDTINSEEQINDQGKVKFSKFKKIYLITVASLTAVILGVFTYLWVSMTIFEKSSPDNVAFHVFNQYFREFAVNRLFAMERSSLSNLESLESYSAYLTKKAGNREWNFRNISSETDSIKRYAVFADGAGFGEFELSERKGIFGSAWELSAVRTVYDYIDALKIVTPADTDVYVNGKRLDKNYIKDAGLFNIMAGSYDVYSVPGLITTPVVEARVGGHSRTLVYDNELNEYSAIPVITADIVDSFTLLINGVQVDDSFLLRDGVRTDETNRLRLHRKIYRVPFGSGEPLNVSVVNPAGTETAINDSGNNFYYQEIAYDSGLETQFRQLGINAAQTYALFMTLNTNLTGLQRYFQTGTLIYEVISTSQVYFYTPHINQYFEKVTASEFLPRGDDSFSCRVTFEHHVWRTPTEPFVFPLDVTLFFRRVGNQYMVYDMISNA